MLEHEVAVLSLRMGHWNGNVFTTWSKLTDLKVSQDVHLCIRVSGATVNTEKGELKGGRKEGEERQEGKRERERERER